MAHNKSPDSALEVDYTKEGLQASHAPARMVPDEPAHQYPNADDKEVIRRRKSTNPWGLSPQNLVNRLANSPMDNTILRWQFHTVI